MSFKSVSFTLRVVYTKSWQRAAFSLWGARFYLKSAS